MGSGRKREQGLTSLGPCHVFLPSPKHNLNHVFYMSLSDGMLIRDEDVNILHAQRLTKHVQTNESVLQRNTSVRKLYTR